MLVVGYNEVETATVSVRNRKQGDLGSMSVDDLVAMLRTQIEEKTKD